MVVVKDLLTLFMFSVDLPEELLNLEFEESYAFHELDIEEKEGSSIAYHVFKTMPDNDNICFKLKIDHLDKTISHLKLEGDKIASGEIYNNEGKIIKEI